VEGERTFRARRGLRQRPAISQHVAGVGQTGACAVSYHKQFRKELKAAGNLEYTNPKTDKVYPFGLVRKVTAETTRVAGVKRVKVRNPS
jgi:hypothetical protein